jgi:pimeloyl-ACP methyl ester carboxylesterase
MLRYAAITAAALIAISTLTAAGSLTALAQKQHRSNTVETHVASSVSESTNASAASLPNIVLVHGAWADGSSWSAVIQRLQAAGYNVTAVQLPMTSLDDDVATVRGVLASQNGPTILVAHSFGGAVITKLGTDAPNVVGAVYESAFAPDQGETMKAFTGSSPQPPIGAAIRPDKQGNLWLDPAGFLQYFAPDVDPIQARVMEAVQKPIPASEFFSEEPFGTPLWKSVPTWYLITENDQAVPPQAQHFFAQRMKATVTTVASSHVAMVSHPDVVTKVIETAAQSVSGGGNTTAPATQPASVPSIPGSGSQTFKETGKTVSGIFLDYWNNHGGLVQQGYPISDLMTEKSPLDGKTYTVQYFERAVFEYHPENQAPYNVLLSQLGTFRYKQLYQGSVGTA